jgi:protein-tyrosine phosphatase
MRQVPGYALWLGHVGDVRDLHGVLSAGIEVLVDLALEEPPAMVTRELVYCRFPLLDGTGNPPWILRAAVDTVAGLLHDGVPTLVFCGAGMSRSPIVAAAAIAKVHDLSLARAVAEVTEDRPADLSPGLLAEVEAAIVDV